MKRPIPINSILPAGHQTRSAPSSYQQQPSNEMLLPLSFVGHTTSKASRPPNREPPHHTPEAIPHPSTTPKRCPSIGHRYCQEAISSAISPNTPNTSSKFHTADCRLVPPASTATTSHYYPEHQPRPEFLLPESLVAASNSQNSTVQKNQCHHQETRSSSSIHHKSRPSYHFAATIT